MIGKSGGKIKFERHRYIYIRMYLDGLINSPRLILRTGNLYKFDVIPCPCDIPEY